MQYRCKWIARPLCNASCLHDVPATSVRMRYIGTRYFTWPSRSTPKDLSNMHCYSHCMSTAYGRVQPNIVRHEPVADTARLETSEPNGRIKPVPCLGSLRQQCLLLMLLSITIGSNQVRPHCSTQSTAADLFTVRCSVVGKRKSPIGFLVDAMCTICMYVTRDAFPHSRGEPTISILAWCLPGQEPGEGLQGHRPCACITGAMVGGWSACSLRTVES